ncbi:type IV secretory system conjugative DNA transfer family protein [Clostridium perfringens]|nr:type IV secretory system conjugative DNA transfer family protein [Clostridium perfringens]
MRVIKNKEKLFKVIRNSNNLIISADGLGTEKLNLIDLYSDENKSSFVTHDPTGKLFKKYKDILEEKGYKVECINSEIPSKSSSYNPLRLIIDTYHNGDTNEALKLCRQLTNSICYDSSEKEPFLQLTLMTLFNSVILAMLENNEGLFNLKDVIELIESLGLSQDEQGKNKLDQYFENMKYPSIGRLEYKRIQYLNIRLKKQIFLITIDKLKKFRDGVISEIIVNNSIDLKDIGFGNKPVAVFLTTPDFEELSNIFIKQLYYVLAKEASRAGTERCKREVIFNLDNFESIYEIENFANIILVCLARGIKFNITIKSLQQLEKVYGENYETILNNCGNLIYISSDNDFTNSYVSEGLDLDLNSFRENNEMIILSHINRCIFRCKLA